MCILCRVPPLLIRSPHAQDVHGEISAFSRKGFPYLSDMLPNITVALDRKPIGPLLAWREQAYLSFQLPWRAPSQARAVSFSGFGADEATLSRVLAP
jgi:hypothetical protein